jgi:hypothetical protein
MLRAIVSTTPRRDGIHALPVRHRPRLRILREQAMNEGRARSHPTNEEDRGRDLGAQNLRALADRPLYRQMLSGHSEAIHPRGDPAREAQRGIFLTDRSRAPSAARVSGLGSPTPGCWRFALANQASADGVPKLGRTLPRPLTARYQNGCASRAVVNCSARRGRWRSEPISFPGLSVSSRSENDLERVGERLAVVTSLAG